MIEQDQHEADVDAAGDVERRVEVREEMRIRSSRQAAIVVLDPGSPIAEDEPANDREAKPGHLEEVASDLVAAGRSAYV